MLNGIKFTSEDGTWAEFRVKDGRVAPTVGAELPFVTEIMAGISFPPAMVPYVNDVGSERGVSMPSKAATEMKFTPDDGEQFLIAIIAAYGRNDAYSKVELIEA
jgi:hypothetical protein